MTSLFRPQFSLSLALLGKELRRFRMLTPRRMTGHPRDVSYPMASNPHKFRTSSFAD